MKVVFRCDASKEIGSGHAYRCMALARALKAKGSEIVFAVNSEALDVVPQLKEFDVQAGDYAGPCDVLVIDHYGLDRVYETSARQWAQRLVVIDDLADREHDPDVLLDQTFGRDVSDYKSLVPGGCEILTGAEYSLLRPEFAEKRAEAMERKNGERAEPFRVLVSLGSTNYKNATGQVLEALTLYRDQALIIDVVVGSSAFDFEVVERAVQALKEDGLHDVSLLSDVRDMAKLMVQADLVIGAAGTSSWERCCFGLPTMLLVLADNQGMIAAELAQAGAVFNAGHIDEFDVEGFVERFSKFLNDGNALQDMSKKAANICDGRGVQRVLPWLFLSEEGQDGQKVRLRMMGAEDEAALLRLQSYPETRKFARNSEAPSAEAHHAWMQKKLADVNSYAYMILVEGAVSGHVRLDQREDGTYEISVLIDPALYGQGIARSALAFLHKLHSDLKIVAEVLPENAASQKLFEKAGYKPLEGNWYRYG